eukprot:1190636-Prorocentrum_minimum.AAC.3
MTLAGVGAKSPLGVPMDALPDTINVLFFSLGVLKPLGTEVSPGTTWRSASCGVSSTGIALLMGGWGRL